MFKLTRYLQKISIKQIALIVPGFFLISCSTLQYYSSLVHGHAEVLNQAREVDDVLADSSTDKKLRDNLQQLKNARKFAIEALYLPDSGSYRSYTDLGRKYVVWNVIVTRELSVEAHEWCFIIVGCIQYRGYYSQADAIDYAEQLKREGYDVYVAGVSAYSTLGWFDDPLLNTMMYKNSEDRLNLLFHEMAHQKLYIKDDSKFNEAFATVVAKEGVIRWLQKTNQSERIAEYRTKSKNKSRFIQLLKETRDELDNIYQRNISDDEKRLLKKQAFIRLKKKYVRLKQSNPKMNFDTWIAQHLNNAHLALLATYNEYVPYFEKKLSENHGDLKSFYASINRLAQQPVEVRRQKISAMPSSAENSQM